MHPAILPAAGRPAAMGQLFPACTGMSGYSRRGREASGPPLVISKYSRASARTSSIALLCPPAPPALGREFCFQKATTMRVSPAGTKKSTRVTAANCGDAAPGALLAGLVARSPQCGGGRPRGRGAWRCCAAGAAAAALLSSLHTTHTMTPETPRTGAPP